LKTKGEEFELYESDIQKLNLYGYLSKPKNLELKQWGNFIKLENSVVIAEKCVRGFTIGAKRIGAPTANIKLSEKIKSQIS